MYKQLNHLQRDLHITTYVLIVITRNKYGATCGGEGQGPCNDVTNIERGREEEGREGSLLS